VLLENAPKISLFNIPKIHFEKDFYEARSAPNSTL